MLCAAAPAFAETPGPKAENNLYLEAMQALAEGRHEEAREVLQRLVASEPEHAGAWLDLAILQCGLGNAREAEALFGTIEQRFSPPPAIREVIANQRAHGCKGRELQWHARYRLGRGVDSNVNQGASNPNFSIGSGNNLVNLVLSPEFTPKRDQFTAASGEFAKELNQAGTLAFAQAQLRQYDRYTDFNLGSLMAGIEHPWRWGGWGLRGSAALGMISLGGKVYQRQSQLQLQVNPPLHLPKPWEFDVVGGWTHVNYPTLTGFDSELAEMRGILSYRTTDLFAQASAGYAFDHGSDQRPGSDRQGAYASLTGRARLHGDIFGELGWTRQSWEGRRAYSPGLIDQQRHQKTDLLRAAVTFPITPSQAVQVEFRDIRNRENISLFEYQGRLLQFNWQWQMGK